VSELLTLQSPDEPLRAYTEALVDLAPEDARYLQDHVRQLRVERPVEGGGYVVNPRQYVGVIALHSGQRLTINPRISAANVLYMLAIAYQFKSPFGKDIEQFESFEELLEPIAEFFADLVQERIEEGLYRSYIDTEDNLPVVRGRIDFPRDVSHNSVLRHRIYCRYSDFTWDIPENQILKYVAYLLSGWNFRQSALRRQLTSLYNQLDEVSRVPFTPERVDSFVYHRLNEPYRRVHRLCALFLDAMSLSERIGETEFRTFLLDMNKLFEAFVTQEMVDRLSTLWTVKPQYPVDLDRAASVHMKPDLVFLHGAHVQAVMDCKYKPIKEGEFVNHDYYQLLAYCIRLGTNTGILIYPRHEIAVEDSVEIMGTDISVRRLSLDLALRPSELRAECNRIAYAIQEWCAERQTSAA
jgi:5-methylcytosine-specific restriction enzyme subunit McrC